MSMNIHGMGYEPSDLHVTISDLLVATADHTDGALDHVVSEVLRTLRDRMKMDVVFVSECVDGQRVFRQVATTGARPTICVGQSDALEASWCQRVVGGRLPRHMADAKVDPAVGALLDQLPFPIGSHISAPIVLKKGEIYGTLCSFTFSPHDNPDPDDLKTPEMTARFTAMRLEGKTVLPSRRDVSDWDLGRD